MSKVNIIKEERIFNAELNRLLEVLKAISVMHFRSLRAREDRFLRFAPVLRGFYEMIDLKGVPHPFITLRTNKLALVIITSEEGFMGELNLKVIEKALSASESAYSELVIVGERGARYLRDMGRKFTLFKGASATAEERYSIAVQLKDYILKGAKEERFGNVLIFYTKPESFIIQKVEVQGILPIRLPPASYNDKVIIDSPLAGIIDFLAEEEVLHKIIDVLENSKLSEFASRAIHLEKSTRFLTEREEALKLRYFRVYHENIDRNIRELYAAQVVGRRK